MKKLIIEILLGIGLPAAIFHAQIGSMFAAEKPVTKQINVSIARDSSYNSQTYNATIATIYVVVFKSGNHRQTIVWEMAYQPMLLKNYPLTTNSMRHTVTVKNFVDSKEKLYVTYCIAYTTNGSTIKVENGTCLERGENQGDVMINM